MEFYMLVLALDTTTRQGSIALVRGGATIDTFAGDAAITHGERLPGDLLRVLSAHATGLDAIDLFAVAAGPGSFTGLRIGIATMQGLALASARPLVGVSALDAIHAAIAHVSPPPDGDQVACWMDAQRGQVFSAIYARGSVVEGACVDTPASFVARWREEDRRPRVFAGDGALAYRDVIHRAWPSAEIVAQVPPLAPSIARLAEAQHQQGPASPDDIRPIYVRRSDAELARDRTA
jgi:tRNA threonylcarbamoyladenosine biosynthesis protein TsaB